MSVRMPSRARPDTSPCSRCGKPKAIHYYVDGSYRSVYHDGPCPKAPPGPPPIPGPQIAKGLFFPESEHEREIGSLRAEVVHLRGQLMQLRKAAFEALGMRLPDSQDHALRITGQEREWIEGQKARPPMAE